MSLKIFTDSQYQMLVSARKYGDAFWHLRLDAATSAAAYRASDTLIEKGWLKFGEFCIEITDAGREALARFEGGHVANNPR